MSSLSIDQMVNLDAYPIAAPDSPACQSLVAEMRGRYADNSVCLLPDFLTKEAVALMAEEAAQAATDSFRCDDTHNSYLEKDDPSLPKDHPRRRLETTRLNVVGCDQLALDGALQTLYRWDPLRDFLGKVLGYDDFHRFADPIGAMAINVMVGSSNLFGGCAATRMMIMPDWARFSMETMRRRQPFPLRRALCCCLAGGICCIASPTLSGRAHAILQPYAIATGRALPTAPRCGNCFLAVANHCQASPRPTCNSSLLVLPRRKG
jgi:hypothetical protein